MFMYVVSSCSKYVREEIDMSAECKGKSDDGDHRTKMTHANSFDIFFRRIL